MLFRSADADLIAIGSACRDLALVTGGSGIALGLPQNFHATGRLAARFEAPPVPAIAGKPAVLAGSCSQATRTQVAAMARTHTAIALDPLASTDVDALVAKALGAVAADLAAGRPFVIYSTAAPEQVEDVQHRLGRETAATLIENTFARLAQALIERGVRRLIVAGGETSGAVVQALGVSALTIGAPIDPGVPWTVAHTEAASIALALKSGNFGAEDFFLEALAMLPE